MRFQPVASVDDLLARSAVADKPRLRLEAELMAARTRATATLVGGTPTWIEVLTGPLTGVRYLITIALPVSGWPWRPPEVYVQEPRIPGYAPHRYGDGRLCLVAPSRYRPSLSVFYMRNRTVAWIACLEIYQRNGEWPASQWREP